MRFNNFWCYRRILLSKGFVKSLWFSRKNLIIHEKGCPPEAGPYMAELDVTYQCNLRCRMCQRWRDPRRGELSFSEYKKLAEEFHRLGVHQISIAGGEPLLRKDIFPIIENFAGRGMSVNLCTNGMLLGKYYREIYSSGVTCVTVSLDGATAESHDKIRGTAGSYHQIKSGIETFLFYRNGMPLLRVRMTISKDNAGEIQRFYKQWDRVADDVLLQPVHHCSHSYYTGMGETSLNLDASVISDQLRRTPMEKDPYMKRLVTSLKENQSLPDGPCYAGLLMVRINPWGHVFPCLEQHVCIGSIREGNFFSIWNSAQFQRERKRLASNRECRCWYNNTALIGHFGTQLKKTVPEKLWRKIQVHLESHFKSIFPNKIT